MRRNFAAAQEAYEKQLAIIRKTHEADLTKTRSSAVAEADRQQRRAEAEVADLRATISRLEVDLMKVCLVTRFCSPAHMLKLRR